MAGKRRGPKKKPGRKRTLNRKVCVFCGKSYQPKKSTQKYCSVDCVRKKGQPGSGRPSSITPEVVNKLEFAFSIGCTDLEACCHADILPESLYKWQKKNPKFVQRKAMLKERPVLLARTKVLAALEQAKDYTTPMDFLKRKLKGEFGTKRIEMTGRDGQPLTATIYLPDNQRNGDSSEENNKADNGTSGN